MAGTGTSAYLRTMLLWIAWGILLISPLAWFGSRFHVYMLKDISLSSPQIGLLQLIAVLWVVFHAVRIVIRTRGTAWMIIRAAVCLLLLLSLEFAAQKVAPPLPDNGAIVTRQDPELGWVWVPNSVKIVRSARGEDIVLRFNTVGLRGPNLNPAQKLLFLGNSVTQAQHVPEGRTFAALMNGINAGFDGYSTFQQRDRFRRDLCALNPATVILVVNAADIMSEEQSRANIRSTLENNATIGGKSVFSAVFLKNIVERSGIRRVLAAKRENQQKRDEGYARKVVSPYPDNTWREWTRAIADIRGLAAYARFCVVLTPPRSIVRMYREGRRDFWLDDRLRLFCASRGIPFLDLLPDLAEFDPDETYIDYIHFNDKGHRYVAQAIARFLESGPKNAREGAKP